MARKQLTKKHRQAISRGLISYHSRGVTFKSKNALKKASKDTDVYKKRLSTSIKLKRPRSRIKIQTEGGGYVTVLR